MITLSVIIPTYNRPDSLIECLGALARQTLSADEFEVIVVNDGGRQDLKAETAGFREALKLTVLNQANSGAATARNKGLASANGTFIAFTDDDCCPTPDWLSELVTNLMENPARMYGGHNINALKDNVYSTASHVLVDYTYDYFNLPIGPKSFFTSNNMAMSRRQLEEIGGFDDSFPGACGEDRDLCERWRDAGFELCYLPTAVVFHHHALSLAKFARQHFNYGTGAWYFHQSREHRKQATVEIEPVAYYSELLSFAWRYGEGRKLRTTLLIILSQAANAWGYYYKKFRNFVSTRNRNPDQTKNA